MNGNMRDLFREALSRALTTGGREIHGVGQYGIGRHDFGEEDRAAFEAVRGLTMTSPERVVALRDCVKYVVENHVAGAFVECGVWRGGSAMVAARTFMECGEQGRELYLYDTFEGMPAPGALDVRHDGTSALETYERSQGEGKESGWAYADIDDVRKNINSTGYPEELLRMIKGKVEATIPETLPGRISILRLDTDFYSSTIHELEALYPLISPGGVLIVDDYGHWSGAKAAVDEFIERHGVALLLTRIDAVARMGVIPAGS